MQNSDHLIANLSDSKVPCISYQHLAAMEFSGAVFVVWHGEQKVTDGEKSALGSASTVQKCGPTNIFDVLEILSDGRSGADNLDKTRFDLNCEISCASVSKTG